jgi:hypothetical protein
MSARLPLNSEALDLVRQGWNLLKRSEYSAAAKDINSHARRLRRARKTGQIDLEGLDEFQECLQIMLFGDPPLYGARRRDVRRRDPRLNVLLDSLMALTLAESSDASYPWMRGSILFAVGRHLESAADFLVAAARLSEERRQGTDLEDIDLWIGGALFHAAKNFAMDQHLLSALVLLPRLDPDDREEIRQLIDRKMTRMVIEG